MLSRWTTEKKTYSLQLQDISLKISVFETKESAMPQPQRPGALPPCQVAGRAYSERRRSKQISQGAPSYTL